MTLGPLWKRNAGREDEPRSLAVFLRWAVLLWVDYSSRIFLLHERRDVFPLQEEEELVVLWTR